MSPAMKWINGNGTVGLTADLNGSIIMNAGVGGSLDSGKIKLFEVGVPGLDFPGYVTQSLIL
jgi:hypothetical protein